MAVGVAGEPVDQQIRLQRKTETDQAPGGRCRSVQPYSNMLGLSVDLLHHADLLIAFGYVLLVDTQGIYPYTNTARFVSKLAERRFTILGYGGFLPFQIDRPISCVISPN